MIRHRRRGGKLSAGLRVVTVSVGTMTGKVESWLTCREGRWMFYVCKRPRGRVARLSAL